jgi:hypothetical protein
MGGILGLVGAPLSASSVHAETIAYEGTPIQGIVPALSGFVTLDTPLAANSTQFFDARDAVNFVPSGVANFDFGSGLSLDVQEQLDSFHNVGGNYLDATFSFTTVNHSITAWDFELDALRGENFNNHSELFESITSRRDTYKSTVCDDAAICSTVISAHAVGTLTRAPEIDPASAASALTLLFGGIAVMRGRKSRV